MWNIRYFVILVGVSMIFLAYTSVETKKSKKPRNNAKNRTKAVTIRADKPGKSNGKCVPVSAKDSGIRLKCSSSDVIYSIDINSYNGTTCDDDIRNVCSGLQPSVLTDSNLCYSRKSCAIIFNNKAPIVKTPNGSCIGRKPSRISASIRCVNKDIFYPLHKTGGNSTVNSLLEMDFGMLVSHDTYPWHYHTGLVIDLILKPQNKDKTKLYISVPVLELDDLDTVNITDYQSGRNQAITKTAEGRATLIQTATEPKTLIKFYTNNASSTAKGFIICFYWTRKDEDLSQVDICTKLKKKRNKNRNKKPSGNAKGEKPKKNKGRGKKRKKKGKKRRKQRRNLKI